MSTKSYPVIDMAATGRNILRLRRARGLSISDMQVYFGFDAPQAIYKWQQGKSLPNIDNIFALSHLLEVPIDEILIPQEPRLKILPQEESCGDHFFGFSSLPVWNNGKMINQSVCVRISFSYLVLLQWIADWNQRVFHKSFRIVR